MKTMKCILGFLSAILTYESMATTYYVDANEGNDARSPSEAENPVTPWASITNAIAHVAEGDVVEVAAGEYPASIEVAVPVTLRGPNADIPWNGVRNPEAVLMADAGNVSILAFSTNNVSISGFLFDGDNPDISGGKAVNGADVNVTYGIANTATTGATSPRVHADHFTFRNNIVRNMNTVALSLSNVGDVSSWNVIHGNFFTNVSFRGISGGNSFYMDVQSNHFDTVASAIFSGTVAGASAPGFHPTVSRNSVTLRDTGNTGTYSGIWLNHRWTPATYPTTVEGNTIEVEGPLPSIYCGIVITSFTGGSRAVVRNNDIQGNGFSGNGYYMWNNSITTNVSISGGTVSGVETGAYVAWWDYIMGPYNGSYMGANNATFDRVAFTNCVVGVVSSNSTPVVRSSLITDCGTGLSVILGSPVFENCTIVGNTETGVSRISGTPLIRNCILWDNGADIVGDVTEDMIHFSDIEDGGYTGNGCISADPMLIGGGDYSLDWRSPCRNRGMNVVEWMEEAQDFIGNPRIHHRVVDMGAYEFVGNDMGMMLIR